MQPVLFDSPIYITALRTGEIGEKEIEMKT